MPSPVIRDQSARFQTARPEVRPGFTVRVHERITEGDKERIQIFEGLVISVHKGTSLTDSTFTVRRIASGVGVERVFPLHSPKIEQIEVKKVAKVRRAKLFFLRGRHGKAARLSERFTNAGEYDAIAVPESEDTAQQEDALEQEAAEDTVPETATEQAPAETKTEEAPAAEVATEQATEEKKEEPKA